MNGRIYQHRRGARPTAFALAALCLIFPALTGSVWGVAVPGYDESSRVAVDASGNVYVAGSSYRTNFDMVVIKYDSTGNWLWGRRYNGPADDHDYLEALAVDAVGNVYITGSSRNGANDDYVTIKYNTNGVWLWGRRYNGPANGNDRPKGLAVDSGNVYVTGESWNGANLDYVTIKYNANGVWSWGQRYNGPANDYDYALALAVDSGNVYVTGRSGNGDNLDYLTIKYNQYGNWVWGRRYNGPANGYDYALALAVDIGGNVHVTGSSENELNDDIVTIKYSAAGDWLWGTRYNSPFDATDGARALAVDAAGNVCVTGRSYNGNNFDWVIVKYSAAGAWLWGIRYNGPSGDGADYPNAVWLDAHSNVYATGDSSNGSNQDYVTIKYSAAGAWLWGARYNGAANREDRALALTGDAGGNLYVTGDSWNTSDPDLVTIKYSATGAWLWGRRYDSPY